MTDQLVLSSVLPARESIARELAALELAARVEKFIDDAVAAMTRADESGACAIQPMDAIAVMTGKLTLRRLTATVVRFDVALELRGHLPKARKRPHAQAAALFDSVAQKAG